MADFSERLKGELLPDMLRYAAWASLAGAVLQVLGFLLMLLFTLLLGLSVIFGNIFALFVCLPMLLMAAVSVFLVVAGWFGGMKVLDGQKGGKTWLMISGIGNAVIGLFSILFGIGLLPLAVGGFILYVVFADEDAKIALERMDAEEWTQHPHDFTAEAPGPSVGDVSATGEWSGKEYSANETYLESPANYMRGKEAVGGKMLIDGERVNFESHGFNFQDGKEFISIADIAGFKKYKSMGIVNNGLTLVMSDGTEHRFVINNREKVISLIQDIKAFMDRGDGEDGPSEVPEPPRDDDPESESF